MRYLMIVHSIGDTKALIDTAFQIDYESCEFLILGYGAEKILTSYTQLHKLHINRLIGDQGLAKTETKPLTDRQLERVTHYLMLKHFTHILVGIPGQPQVAAPLQIAKQLAEQIQYGAIYNEYLFYDPSHCFWQYIADQQPWCAAYDWLVPLPQIREKIHKQNPYLTCYVVGHMLLEQQRQPYQPSIVQSEAFRDALDLKRESPLILLAGTKDTELDGQLIHLLAEHNGELRQANSQLRMTLHPGLVDAIGYLNAIADKLDRKTIYKLRQYFKIILPLSVMTYQHELTESLHDLTLQSTMTSPMLFPLTDGLCSALPSALLNLSIWRGKPCFYLAGEYEPYIQQEYTMSGESQIFSFLQAVSNRKRAPSLTKSALGCPEAYYANVIADLFKNKSPTFSHT